MESSPSHRSLDPRSVADAVYTAIGEISCSLRADFRDALECITLSKRKELESCTDKAQDAFEIRSIDVLSSIIANDDIAHRDHVPICQDTGTVWVCLEIGSDISVNGDIFSGVNDAVSRAYKDNLLRMSLVKDALFDRSNTMNNTPAFCELRAKDGVGATLHVMLKGGGSDNASRLVMCAPGEGKKRIIDEVLACVKEKAANACPPLVVGIGIGATFDKVASLAKHALLRPIGSVNPNEDASLFEAELLEMINATNIGPGALGGTPTAIAVHVETAPCHIAALPLAINMGCSAMRSCSIEL